MHQRGVGLIEVLIAVLILAIGFLGISLVQTRALTNNSSSMARSMAVVAVYSILDGMRVDRTKVVAGSYNTTVTANACPTGTSTLAANLLLQWCAELGNRLGATANTTGNIACDTTPVCTVTVNFDDSRADAVTGNAANAQGITSQSVIIKTAL